MAMSTAPNSTHSLPSPKRARVRLAGSDAQAFRDAVTNPPAPSEKLVAAFHRHKAIVS